MTTDPAPDILSAVLVRHALSAPRDGDCTAVSDAVTAELREHRQSARQAVVTGWLDPASLGFDTGLATDAKLVAFLHRVTVCGDLVLDGTARQFDPDLPSAWILPINDYRRELAARMPAITDVTIDDTPFADTADTRGSAFTPLK